MLAATISLVGHDCLFRGQETFSGIQVKDVKWNLDQRIVTLHIGSPQEPGKVAQDGSGYDVHIGVNSDTSGYKYLKCWFDAHMLWGRKSLYIFPRLLQASSSHKAQMIFTVDQQEVVRATTLSYEASHFSVHSHRAGGVTDLGG